MAYTFRLVTPEQLSEITTAFAEDIVKNDYVQKKDLKSMAYVDQLPDDTLPQSIKDAIDEKVDLEVVLERVADFGEPVYKAGGSFLFDDLPEPEKKTAGYVYNVLNRFTTDKRFVEGEGSEYDVGTNVAVIQNAEGDYVYDVLTGQVELDVAATREQIEELKEKLEYDIISFDDINEVIGKETT